MSLTPSEDRAWRFIDRHMTTSEVGPTFAEIGKELGCTSARVSFILAGLQEKGFIHKTRYGRRSIKLLKCPPAPPASCVIKILPSGDVDVWIDPVRARCRLYGWRARFQQALDRKLDEIEAGLAAGAVPAHHEAHA